MVFGLSAQEKADAARAKERANREAARAERVARNLENNRTYYDYHAQANQFLIDSAKAGNNAGVIGALAAGADANICEFEDDTRPRQVEGARALMLLLQEAGPDGLEGVKALIAAGADVNARLPRDAQGHEGASVISIAAGACAKDDHCQKDAEPLIDALIAAGAKVDDGFHNGKTPAFSTVNEYDGRISVTALKALFKHGANPEAVWTPGNYSVTLLDHVSHTANQRSGEYKSMGVDAIEAVTSAIAKRKSTPDGKGQDGSAPTQVTQSKDQEQARG